MGQNGSQPGRAHGESSSNIKFQNVPVVAEQTLTYTVPYQSRGPKLKRKTHINKNSTFILALLLL